MTATPGAGSATGGATRTTGNLYDLGYQGYVGPRLGRRHAVWALYTFSLRGAFGIGRSGRSKIAPFGFAFLALLPALVAVGVQALVSQGGGPSAFQSPIRYDSYLGFSQTMLILFCAAQAPELVGRDQRYTVLPLYFSRALRREDYALSKVAALGTAVFGVYLVPEAILFLGRVLASRDVAAAFLENLPAIPPILAVGASAAALLGGISLALASFTPRRPYATAAIIAAFVVPPIVLAIVADVSPGTVTGILVFLDPVDLLTGANATLFGSPPSGPTLRDADLPGWAYVAGLLVQSAGAVLATIRRYQRIAA